MKGKTLELRRFNNIGRQEKLELPKAGVSKSRQPTDLIGGAWESPSLIVVTQY